MTLLRLAVIYDAVQHKQRVSRAGPGNIRSDRIRLSAPIVHTDGFLLEHGFSPPGGNGAGDVMSSRSNCGLFEPRGGKVSAGGIDR